MTPCSFSWPSTPSRDRAVDGHLYPAADRYDILHPHAGLVAHGQTYGSAQDTVSRYGREAFITCRGLIVPRLDQP